MGCRHQSQSLVQPLALTADFVEAFAVAVVLAVVALACFAALMVMLDRQPG
tara:strand:- start:289 stop:441 length:153 start_codon:yes stop_codon:yes gene_type:complete